MTYVIGAGSFLNLFQRIFRQPWSVKIASMYLQSRIRRPSTVWGICISWSTPPLDMVTAR